MVFEELKDRVGAALQMVPVLVGENSSWEFDSELIVGAASVVAPDVTSSAVEKTCFGVAVGVDSDVANMDLAAPD